MIEFISMKTKLTISVEKNLIAKAKQTARGQNTSVSQIVEDHLKDLTSRKESSFSTRWRGYFKIRSDSSDRMNYLLSHHLKAN